MVSPLSYHVFFFFNDTATTEIYTLSLHDALPIFVDDGLLPAVVLDDPRPAHALAERSEEQTSELQSHLNLVCRLLLEKNKSRTSVSPIPPKRARQTSESRRPGQP